MIPHIQKKSPYLIKITLDKLIISLFSQTDRHRTYTDKLKKKRTD